LGALLIDVGIFIAEGVLSTPVESLAIVLILFFNAGLGVYQESKAAGPRCWSADACARTAR
jgi:Ca2+-transporting ATPase